MTEDQKYQGALYKDKNKKAKIHNNTTPDAQRNDKSSKMAQPAYVEDFEETWRDYQGQTDDERSPAEPPPEAPTPPSAVNEDHVNVFDFLVATGQTPNASNLNLPRPQDGDESKSLVRYEYDAEEYLDPTSFVDKEDLAQYGAGPYETPSTSKHDRRKKNGDVKTDKKRKRLHVDVPGDSEMTDAPPVLSSGLTGGLKSLMRPTLPPSPNYSSGDVADAAPASPLKKTKHSNKHSKNGQISNSIFGMIAGNSKTKTKTKKHKSSKKHSSRSKDKGSKLIEYRPQSKDSKDGQAGEEGQMILFKPRADVFFDFINKGPESERGCSMNKTLKRFHRERQAAGSNMSKHLEEKELWRSIRLRRNEQGEIVLFSVDDE